MLCLIDAIYNYKWVKILQIWQIDFEILLFDVTFHIWNMVFNVLIQNAKTNIIVTTVSAHL